MDVHRILANSSHVIYFIQDSATGTPCSCILSKYFLPSLTHLGASVSTHQSPKEQDKTSETGDANQSCDSAAGPVNISCLPDPDCHLAMMKCAISMELWPSSAGNQLLGPPAIDRHIASPEVSRSGPRGVCLCNQQCSYG